MREVTATEARTRWAELLRAVEHGEIVSIARHGRVVARMVPVRNAQAIDRFRQRRAEWKSASLSTDEVLSARHCGHRF